MCSDTADALFRDAERAWGLHGAAGETRNLTTAHAGAVQHRCLKGSWTIRNG